jgi:hypothetical protein
MQFETKLQAALDLLASTGIWRSSYAPPIYRFFWLIRVRIPPPHFMGFKANLLISGSLFGSLWGIFTWYTILSHSGASPLIAIFSGIFAGLFFGLCMALYYRYSARKKNIPSWKSFCSDNKTR